MTIQNVKSGLIISSQNALSAVRHLGNVSASSNNGLPHSQQQSKVNYSSQQANLIEDGLARVDFSQAVNRPASPVQSYQVVSELDSLQQLSNLIGIDVHT